MNFKPSENDLTKSATGKSLYSIRGRVGGEGEQKRNTDDTSFKTQIEINAGDESLLSSSTRNERRNLIRPERQIEINARNESLFVFFLFFPFFFLCDVC